MTNVRTIYPVRGWLRVLWPTKSSSGYVARCTQAELGDIPGIQLNPSSLDVPYTAWMLPEVQAVLEEFGAKVPPLEPLYNGSLPTTWGARKLYEHQLDGVEFILDHTGVVLADEMGVGKLQPVDAKVLTPTGWREIGDLRVEDFVLGSDGHACEVTGVYPQGVQKIYRVRFSDGSSVEAGGDHLWTVGYRRGGRTWAELTVTTDELRLRGKHGNVDLAKTVLYLPMLSAPCLFAPSGSLPLDAYTVGALIANGYLSSTATFSFNAVDREHFERRLPLDAVHIYGGAARANIRGVIGILRALGLCVRSSEKFIPAAYQRGKIDDRIALLQGLMDCDGTISATNNRISYATTSLRLANDVVELVECLGGIASIRTYDRTDEGKTVEYCVRMRLPVWAPPFSLSRKLGRYKPGAHASPRRTVVGVEYVRDAEAVCIRVRAEDQLYVTERCILTHNTTTAIVSAALMMKRFAPRPALIIGTKAVQQVWRRELMALGLLDAPSDFCALASRNLDDASFWRTAKWYFVHYEIVKAWWSRLYQVRPAIVILDEAHYVKHGETQRSVGASMATAGSAQRILLTGTPMENRPAELFNLLTIACGPKTWGYPSLFRKRYCGAVHDGFGLKDQGPTNVAELRRRLASVYLRRTTQDAGIDLPPFTRTSNICDLGVFRREYTAVADKLDSYDIDTLPSLVRSIAEGLKQAVLPELTRLREITSRAKVPTTREFVHNALEQDEAVVVFTWTRETAEAIYQGLGSHRKILAHGGVSQKQRQIAIDTFQACDQEPIALITTFGAMAEGVTLHRARICVMHDIDWTLTSMLQAEKRVHRIGQTRGCQAVWMLAAGTIDTLIAPILLRKAELMHELLGIRYDIRDDVGLTELAGRPAADALIEQAFAAWRGGD